MHQIPHLVPLGLFKFTDEGKCSDSYAGHEIFCSILICNHNGIVGSNNTFAVMEMKLACDPMVRGPFVNHTDTTCAVPVTHTMRTPWCCTQSYVVCVPPDIVPSHK